VRTGAQEHFYLETNAALVVPTENDEYTVWSSTQNPTKTQVCVSSACAVAVVTDGALQMLVAAILNVPANRVVCKACSVTARCSV
jgi:hypothetical protein